MKLIAQEYIPILPVQDILDGECIAYGVGDAGVVVQYMERNACILIEWPDVLRFGIEILKAGDKPKPEEEIVAPTVVE